ncbi:hypothetical protein, partial [Bacillus mycoides]|uniref:hypothetical protein n=1 Tax=Bacillus mycoides TaxID=1405 RepID=UPI0011A939EE
RFLNRERVTVPDIDMDFADIRGDEMIGYVKDKYGGVGVGEIVRFGRLAGKGGIGDMGGVMGLGGREIEIF